jgi:hypothetical protein
MGDGRAAGERDGGSASRMASSSSSSTCCSSAAKSNSFVGTEDYVVPEIVAGSRHDYAVDWWGLGVVLYEMLYGRTPFRRRSRRESGKPTPLRDLIGLLLEKDPGRRLCAHGVKRHAFFRRSSRRLTTTMLAPRPRRWTWRRCCTRMRGGGRRDGELGQRGAAAEAAGKERRRSARRRARPARQWRAGGRREERSGARRGARLLPLQALADLLDGIPALLTGLPIPFLSAGGDHIAATAGHHDSRIWRSSAPAAVPAATLAATPRAAPLPCRCATRCSSLPPSSPSRRPPFLLSRRRGAVERIRRGKERKEGINVGTHHFLSFTCGPTY